VLRAAREGKLQKIITKKIQDPLSWLSNFEPLRCTQALWSSGSALQPQGQEHSMKGSDMSSCLSEEIFISNAKK